MADARVYMNRHRTIYRAFPRRNHLGTPPAPEVEVRARDETTDERRKDADRMSESEKLYDERSSLQYLIKDLGKHERDC